MKRFLSLLACASMFYTGAMAQSNATTGLIFDRDILTAPSFYSLAQREYNGTARSMAMGGAFTSLGADMSSFGINPAGFGMYQRNEISVTLGVGNHNSKNSGVVSADRGNNATTQFSINNIGGSFKVYEGTGDLLAVNFAFGYNKTADYNYDLNYHGATSKFSVADAFADLASREGLSINSDGKICDARGYVDYEMNPYYWGTVLAYKGGLINRGDQGWVVDEIGQNASIDQFTRLQSRGSAGEFSFAVGLNYNNIIYFGASLDIASINRRQSIYYSENISYGEGQMPDGVTMPYRLNEFTLSQQMRTSGAGIGAKFGIIVRPANGLRIGFAVHTPTYYVLRYSYIAGLQSEATSAGTNPGNYEVINGNVYADELSPRLTDEGEYSWAFTTPTRLLAGISYTAGKYAVFSADYQYDAYRAVRVDDAPLENCSFINDDLRNGFRGQHTVRAGIEVRPTPAFALRIGGGYITRATRFADMIFTEPIIKDAWYASAGLGFRLSKVTSIDVAYQFRKNKYTDYNTFYSDSGNGIIESPIYGLTSSNHNVAVSFGFRF